MSEIKEELNDKYRVRRVKQAVEAYDSGDDEGVAERKVGNTAGTASSVPGPFGGAGAATCSLDTGIDAEDGEESKLDSTGTHDRDSAAKARRVDIGDIAGSAPGAEAEALLPPAPPTLTALLPTSPLHSSAPASVSPDSASSSAASVIADGEHASGGGHDDHAMDTETPTRGDVAPGGSAGSSPALAAGQAGASTTRKPRVPQQHQYRWRVELRVARARRQNGWQHITFAATEEDGYRAALQHLRNEPITVSMPAPPQRARKRRRRSTQLQAWVSDAAQQAAAQAREAAAQEDAEPRSLGVRLKGLRPRRQRSLKAVEEEEDRALRAAYGKADKPKRRAGMGASASAGPGAGAGAGAGTGGAMRSCRGVMANPEAPCRSWTTAVTSTMPRSSGATSMPSLDLGFAGDAGELDIDPQFVSDISGLLTSPNARLAGADGPTPAPPSTSAAEAAHAINDVSRLDSGSWYATLGRADSLGRGTVGGGGGGAFTSTAEAELDAGAAGGRSLPVTLPVPPVCVAPSGDEGAVSAASASASASAMSAAEAAAASRSGLEMGPLMSFLARLRSNGALGAMGGGSSGGGDGTGHDHGNTTSLNRLLATAGAGAIAGMGAGRPAASVPRMTSRGSIIGMHAPPSWSELAAASLAFPPAQSEAGRHALRCPTPSRAADMPLPAIPMWEEAGLDVEPPTEWGGAGALPFPVSRTASSSSFA